MSFLDQRDLARWGREERDLAQWGRKAREWLTRDERGRTIRLVVLSLTISIAMSLLATAIVGFVSRRRAAAPVDAAPPNAGEPMADVGAAPEEVAGVGPGMGLEVPPPADEPARAVGV